jgi:hypothetical protein
MAKRATKPGDVREECAQIVEHALSFGQLKMIGHGLAEVIRRGSAAGTIPVPATDMADAIVKFCDHAGDLSEPAAREALRNLIDVANRIRTKGPTCGNQNDDYPNLRCSRRSGHRGRHENRARGASW